MAHPTILSLFSGVGGLDLGIKLALPGAVVLGYVERDAYAATVLMARMEDKSLERTPVFIGDIQNLDGSELRDRVDILCGGFPCQDISVAGKGVGITGKRSGLWSEIVRLADEIRPRYIFLENVSAIITRGLSTVLADLAALGFDAEWLCLRASDVGAPHRRERWFCLAYSNLNRCEVERCGGVLDGERTTQRNDADGCDDDVANAEGCKRRQLESQWGPEERVATSGAGAAMDDAENDRHERCGDARRWGRGSADELGSMDDADNEGLQGQQQAGTAPRPTERTNGVFPPGPADHDAWQGIAAHLAPAVEPGFRVLVDGVPVVVDESRADQLRCCGNGVVPLQVAVAFTELLRRMNRKE